MLASGAGGFAGDGQEVLPGGPVTLSCRLAAGLGCSGGVAGGVLAEFGLNLRRRKLIAQPAVDLGELRLSGNALAVLVQTTGTVAFKRQVRVEIGRASCRERV